MNKRYSKIFIAIGVILFVALSTMFIVNAVTSERIIRVFILDGIIVDKSNSSSGYITPTDIRNKLESSENVGAVVLRVNSPGGSVVASQEMLDIIRKFRDKTHIPVVYSMGEVAASGGYYIALGADKIVANAGTLTGSIGVISEFMYLEGLYEKLGIKTEIVKSGKYKDMGRDILSSEERKRMQALSDNIYDQFTSEVAKARNMDIDRVRELATGEVYSGEQAKELGLVDKVGTLDDAIQLATKLANISEPKIDIKSGGGLFSGLLGVYNKVIYSLNMATTPGLRISW